MPEKKSINLEILRDIIQIMKEEDVGEICIEQNGLKIKVKRSTSTSGIATQGMAMLEDNRGIADSLVDKGILDELAVISAPMVGTFYKAPAPDAPAFVKVGDTIEVGQVVCIIEAMKLMNEIKSEVKGKIVSVVVDNADPVEFGQTLFLIEPA